jgi:alkylation response protein AidB-like acyl-CoA dehydrogenase
VSVRRPSSARIGDKIAIPPAGVTHPGGGARSGVNVQLSDEQVVLQDTARRLAAAHATETADDLPPADHAADSMWAVLADAGLLALRIPTDLGGMGATAVEVALVAEQLGGRLCAAPYAGQGVIVPALLSAAGADEEALSAGSGSLRWAVGLADDLTAIAAPGAPVVAWDGLDATDVITVDADGSAWRRRLEGEVLSAIDLTRRTVRLAAGPAERVGRRPVDPGARVRIGALCDAVVCADLVGLMQRSLDLSVEHVTHRVQFGRPVGSFQAVQHLLADAAVLVEGARSSMWHAAWAVDALEPTRARSAAWQAKAYCGRAARRVVEIAVQCHGGVAITREHMAHVIVRRVLADMAAFGSTDHVLRMVAEGRLGAGPVERSCHPATEPEHAPMGGLDFADAPEEARFRSELRKWLAANGQVRTLPRDGDARMDAAHRWHRTLAEGGFVGLSFPAEYGGHGRSVVYDLILNDELGAGGHLPAPPLNHITNAIRLYGSETQKRAHLPGLLSCTVRWCQGFSEPNAGSDLAGVATRAELFDGAGNEPAYHINGQKIWTSEAIWAQWCLLLARTERDLPAHRGLSMLLVPMDTPGIDCRPIITAYGSSEFAEVFFDDVGVDASNLLGQPGQGWEIAMSLLGFERGPSDMGWTARLERQLTLLEADVREGRVHAGPRERQRLAEAWVDLEALKLQVQRSTTRRLDGSSPGPEGSIDKLLMTNADQLLAHALLDVLGAAAVLDEAVAFAGYVWSRAQSIFGGTQQIQRDIVAQRVLGLPRAR